jgi:hypothetical protein
MTIVSKGIPFQMAPAPPFRGWRIRAAFWHVCGRNVTLDHYTIFKGRIHSIVRNVCATRVNQVVDSGVGGGDFAVDARNLRGGELAGMLLFVQFQHPVNGFHHLVVPGLVGSV